MAQGIRHFLQLNIILSLWVASALLGLRSARGEAAREDSDLKQRFLTEAPVKLAEYANRCTPLQGSFRSQSTTKSGAHEYLRHDDDLFKRNGKSRLHISTTKMIKDGKTDYESWQADVINSDYAFGVRRQTATSPWVVTDLYDIRRGRLPIAQKWRWEDSSRGFPWERLGPWRLLDIIRHPKFRLVNCHPIAEGAEPLVEIIFDWPHEVEEVNGNSIQGGILVLDPQQWWSVRRYDCRVRDKYKTGSWKFEILEFVQKGGPLRIPKRTVEKRNFVGTDSTTTQLELRNDYNLDIPDRLPGSEEFRLQAFGLPEPPLSVSANRSVPLYLWLTIGGALCLILGVVSTKLKGWAERRATASAGTR